jgi:hypothetical protein
LRFSVIKQSKLHFRLRFWWLLWRYKRNALGHLFKFIDKYLDQGKVPDPRIVTKFGTEVKVALGSGVTPASRALQDFTFRPLQANETKLQRKEAVQALADKLILGTAPAKRNRPGK